jgi:hypothetical protein
LSIVAAIIFDVAISTGIPQLPVSRRWASHGAGLIRRDGFHQP